jgi:hypothetical protein
VRGRERLGRAGKGRGGGGVGRGCVARQAGPRGGEGKLSFPFFLFSYFPIFRFNSSF